MEARQHPLTTHSPVSWSEGHLLCAQGGDDVWWESCSANMGPFVILGVSVPTFRKRVLQQ